MGQLGGIKILRGLNYNIKEIDISDNNIGSSLSCIELLCDILRDRKYSIEVLKIDSNKINDHHTFMICDCLLMMSNKTLKVLNMGHNLITDNGALQIAEMLEVNSTNLKELRICWNQIKARGGSMIAHALSVNI